MAVLMSLWRFFDITKLGAGVTIVWERYSNLEMFEDACYLVWDVSNQFIPLKHFRLELFGIFFRGIC